MSTEPEPREMSHHTASYTDGIGMPQQCFKEKSSTKTEQCNNKYGESSFVYRAQLRTY
jgi:hypothetical protein